VINRHGILHLNGENLIAPGLRETDFTRSSLGAAGRFGANDGYSRYHRVSGALDNGLTCAATVIFYEGVLNSLSFAPLWPGAARSWAEWSEAGELRVKALNDQLLREYLGPPPYVYAWGTIESDYDPKSGGSSIVVRYHHSHGKESADFADYAD